MNKQKNLNKHKLNNRGMSLIEVMVAVIILAVVSIPLLHAFTTSARYSLRAKERQRVTYAAQGIMEGMKAYDLANISCQFNGLEGFSLYSGTVGSVWEVPTEDRNGDGTLDVSAWDEGGKHMFLPTSSNTYTFGLKDINFDGKLYDARLLLFPNAASVSMINVSTPREMNAYLDGIYRQPLNQDMAVLETMQNKVLEELLLRDHNFVYTLSDIDTDKISIDKVTTITINKDSGNPNINMVNVVSEYQYRITNYPYYNDMFLPAVFSKNFDPISTVVSEIYNNTDTVAQGAMLQNVYAYFYPAYNNEATGLPILTETIRIVNNTGVEKNVYLIKQRRDGISDGTLNTCENSYTPRIEGSGSGIVLYHNLDTNLSGISSTVGSRSYSGVTSRTDIMTENTKIMVYDIQIDVYEQGAADGGFMAEPVLTLKGSMNDD